MEQLLPELHAIIAAQIPSSSLAALLRTSRALNSASLFRAALLSTPLLATRAAIIAFASLPWTSEAAARVVEVRVCVAEDEMESVGFEEAMRLLRHAVPLAPFVVHYCGTMLPGDVEVGWQEDDLAAWPYLVEKGSGWSRLKSEKRVVVKMEGGAMVEDWRVYPDDPVVLMARGG